MTIMIFSITFSIAYMTLLIAKMRGSLSRARHTAKVKALPNFAKAIKALPLDKQDEVIEQARKKFNQEVSVINTLKHLRKSTGQLKFRLYDMERPTSGSLYDSFAVNTPLAQPIRLLISLEVDLGMLGMPQGSMPLLASYARIVAHAALDAIQVEEPVLKAVQDHMRVATSNSEYLLFAKKNVQKFVQGILEGPVSLPEEEHVLSF
jgi:hypothetical protein